MVLKGLTGTSESSDLPREQMSREIKKKKKIHRKRPKSKNGNMGDLEQVSAGGRERAEMHGSQSQAGCDRP